MLIDVKDRLRKKSQWKKSLFHHHALSGGRTSGLMLHKWLKHMGGCPENTAIIFCNTGREDERTFRFLHEIETRWGVKVVWLEYTRVPASTIDPSIFPTKKRGDHVRKQAENGEDTHWFKQVTFETAHRKDQPDRPFDKLLDWMSVLPNNQVRACSTWECHCGVRYPAPPDP